MAKNVILFKIMKDLENKEYFIKNEYSISFDEILGWVATQKYGKDDRYDSFYDGSVSYSEYYKQVKPFLSRNENKDIVELAYDYIKSATLYYNYDTSDKETLGGFACIKVGKSEVIAQSIYQGINEEYSSLLKDFIYRKDTMSIDNKEYKMIILPSNHDFYFMGPSWNDYNNSDRLEFNSDNFIVRA